MGYFDADAEDMLEVYLLETRQLTGQLSAVLLDTEKKNAFSGEEIHSIFRIMHTIKSSSAMMGLQELSSMAHKLEDLFAYYRENYGKIEKAEPELFDLLFAASDYIETELGDMENEDYKPRSTAVIEERTEAYLKKVNEPEGEGAATAVDSEEKTEAGGAGEAAGDVRKKVPVIPDTLAGKSGTIVRILFENGCRMENIRAFMLIRQISGMCSAVETWPGELEKSGESCGYISENGVFIRFETERKEEVLESLRRGLFVADCMILAEEGPKTAAEEAADGPGGLRGENASSGENGKFSRNGLIGKNGQAESRETEFFNVRSDRLDRLQAISGELMLHMLTLENQLENLGLEEIKEGSAHQISRLISEMERNVMEMRLVSINKMVPKLRRILRDICRDQNKEADLILECGDLEADKSVVEYVSEALMHIIRNAVDHGIETPEEREAAGKSRKGRITFSAESTAGELRLSLSDDGIGLDEGKIRERARERGLFTRPEEEYDLQEIQELILSPGFTTNEQVTEYSGRGVGLDVVKNVLEDVGGNLYIHSVKGKGTTFTIVVPLSLATMECIRFRVGDYRFSVPARHVYRFLDLEKNRDNVERINGKDYILYEDRMVPLIDLNHFYHLQAEEPEHPIVVYVKGNEKEGCILVDFMYEQKRIVVKQLPPLFGLGFRKRTGISGCSIMGNGSVCAAIDTEILIGLYEKEDTYGSLQQQRTALHSGDK
ncbi:ATP-binding protein [Eisenbergiella sp.]